MGEVITLTFHLGTDYGEGVFSYLVGRTLHVRGFVIKIIGERILEENSGTERTHKGFMHFLKALILKVGHRKF